jgi:hypothetical protein
MVKDDDLSCKAIFEDGFNLREIIFAEDLIKVRITFKNS